MSTVAAAREPIPRGGEETVLWTESNKIISCQSDLPANNFASKQVQLRYDKQV